MQGEIITFYSYKGGTGRSMALANTACLLSRESNSGAGKVLMIDWDLEAPGLHRYFQNHFKKQLPRGLDSESWINERSGLLDLFKKLNEQIPDAGYGETAERDTRAFQHAREILANVRLDDYVLQTDISNLYLLKAGRFNGAYAQNVNSFDWDNLHSRNRWLFRALVEELTRSDRYRYVLIDSRTGLTDTSNICTTLMPEKLVVVFTPNRQSFTGVSELIKNATRYRLSSDDTRPLAVFPLPSRIESLREQLRKDWRYGNQKAGIDGYQPLFTRLFMEIYQLDEDECDLEEYFSEVQIQQSPDFAFGEEIAVNVDEQQDRFSLARSYETFTQKLIHLDLPWERRPSVEVSAVDIAQRAEQRFGRCDAEHQLRMRRIFTRLVRIALPGEGADTMKGANVSEFGGSAERLIQLLVDDGILIRQTASDAGQDTLEVADEGLIREWPRLREWIDGDRDFLSWRQQLRAYLAEWEKQGRSSDELLTGTSLNKALQWQVDHLDDLNEAELEYIRESSVAEPLSPPEPVSSKWRYWRGFWQWAALLVAASVLTVGAYTWIKDYRESRVTAEAESLTSEGRRAYDAGNQKDAILFYNQAIAKKSDYASAYLNRGDAYRALNDREKAIADYEKAIALTKDLNVLRLARSARESLDSPTPTPTPTPIDELYPGRVYVNVAESGVPKFDAIEKVLKFQGFIVIRGLNGDMPPVTEVRYYRHEERSGALEIVDLLRRQGVTNVKPIYLNKENTPARLWHYEIWFSRDVLRPAVTE